MRRPARDQFTLFRDYDQLRKGCETARVYAAVVLLRAAKLPVYRRGREHCVDGRIVDTKQLFAWAQHALLDGFTTLPGPGKRSRPAGVHDRDQNHATP